MERLDPAFAGDVAASARSLVGVSFSHRGRSRNGLDCAGVVWLARRMAFGLTKDERHYSPRPTSQMVLDGISRHADRVGLRDAGPGDVVVLRSGSFATHLGVLTETGVIHAIPGVGVVETPRQRLAAEGRMVAAFRLSRF